MFQRLIEEDWLTGKVTNHRVQTPINQARQVLRDKGENEVRRLWKEIDTVLAKWVAANRRTRLEQAVGLEDIDTPKGCLRRLPGFDDADLFKVLLFEEYPPLQRLMHGDKDNVPQVLATLALHEAACGRIDGVLKAANLLGIARTKRARKQATTDWQSEAGQGKKGKEGPVKAALRMFVAKGYRTRNAVIQQMTDTTAMADWFESARDPLPILVQEVIHKKKEVHYRDRQNRDKILTFKRISNILSELKSPRK